MCSVKCNQSRSGFELVSLCSFPTTITIIPRVPPHYTTGIYGNISCPTTRLESTSELWKRKGTTHSKVYQNWCSTILCNFMLHKQNDFLLGQYPPAGYISSLLYIPSTRYWEKRVSTENIQFDSRKTAHLNMFHVGNKYIYIYIYIYIYREREREREFYLSIYLYIYIYILSSTDRLFSLIRILQCG